jgi:thioredoxin
MKRITLCLAALLVLAACNKKSEDSNPQSSGNNTAQSEMTVDNSADDDQGQWLKQTTLLSNKPMVVDFYATWCGPCKRLAPILEEIEQKHQGDVIFKRVDVDQEPELAMEFQVESIPLLVFITPKGEYQTLTGLNEPQIIEAKIASLLARSAQ